MPKQATRKPIPSFASEREEREFWESHDTTPFTDWSEARAALFANLRPSTETISLRLPTALLSELKALANKRDVPYQSLLKVFLAERVAREAVRVEARPRKAVPPTSRARRKPKSRRPSRAARG